MPTLTPATAEFFYTPAYTPTLSAVRTQATGNKLYINDVDWSCSWKESTFKVTKNISASWSAEVQLEYTSGPVPEPGHEVSMFWDSVKRFGGLVQSVTNTGRQGRPAGPTVLTVRFTGYSAYMDRVTVAELYTLPMGGTAGITMYELWRKHLKDQFGITKNGDAGSDVIGEQLFHYITMTECANRICAAAPGWNYWITDDKELVFANTTPSSSDAPFDIADGSPSVYGNADTMDVTVSNEKFRNKQYVLPSANLIALRTETTTATAGQINFETQYNLTQPPLISVDSGGGPVEEAVTVLGTWDGSPWYYIPNGIGVFRSPGAPSLSGGDVVVVRYPNPFPIAYSVQDDASIAAVGLYEAVYQGKNIIDEDTALAVAQGLLDIYGTDGNYPQAITYTYNSDRQPEWLLPGMIQQVNKTFPLAVGLYTVEQVSSQEYRRTVWVHTVTLRASLGDVTEEQALQNFRTSARVPIVSPPVRATFEIDLLNTGQSVGVLPNRFTVQLPPGVQSVGIASWDAWFPTDPPTGDDWIADLLLSTDGGLSYTSLFNTGEEMTVADGSTLQTGGYRFAVENQRIVEGNIIAVEVLQVGSTNPGSYALAHLNFIV